MVVLVYIDDMIIMGDHTSAISMLKRVLERELEIKDLAELKYFLGIEVAKSQHGFYTFKQKYALDLLFDHGLRTTGLQASIYSYTVK